LSESRFEPYTALGIARITCARAGCASKSHEQWNFCADKVGEKTRFRGLCKECDVGLNEVSMRYIFGDAREADLAEYREKVLG
jgi:hypothetical protein